jgi:prolipoprotein diacylglyceryltransferase
MTVTVVSEQRIQATERHQFLLWMRFKRAIIFIGLSMSVLVIISVLSLLLTHTIKGYEKEFFSCLVILVLGIAILGRIYLYFFEPPTKQEQEELDKIFNSVLIQKLE